MPSLAYAIPVTHVSRMPLSPEDEEAAKRMGAGLRALREQRGLTIGAAGKAFSKAGISRQGWGLYELGKRQAIFKPAMQSKLAKAIGVTIDEWMLEVARLESPEAAPTDQSGSAHVGENAARGFSTAGVELFSCLNTATTRVAKLEDDTLRPWASSGMVIVYDTTLWPRADEGCVVEHADGRLDIKLFGRADRENLILRELHPTPREIVEPRVDVVGVYRVTARLD